MALFLDIALYAFLLAIAVAVARTRDLLAAAMLLGIFSLLSAGVFTLLDAVDVAFTEAAVGAGISTILVVGTLALTDEREVGSKHPFLPLLIVALTGAALIYGTLDMPDFGDPDAPIHTHVAPRYLAEVPAEVGIPNVVTAVLASYRGYDTLGELVVVFTAGIGVLLLLGGPRPSTAPPASAQRRHLRMRETLVLRVVVKRFVPFVLLFALYVQAHGELGPGGGFQAGVIFAAGLVLYSMIFGIEDLRRVVPARAVEWAFAGGSAWENSSVLARSWRWRTTRE